MRPVFEGIYELFIVRKPELAHYQGIFATFPHLSEWSMNDLYERHPNPDKPFLYRYKGRKDDIIVLSNGEKIAPALMEAALMNCPLVRSAMIIGHGKFQPAALIELASSCSAKTENGRYDLVTKLLPFISDANIHAPAHGQLDRYHILIADPARPMQCLGQGKMRRYATHQLYETDIEKLYEDTDGSKHYKAKEELPSLDFSSRQTLMVTLQALISNATGVQDLGDGQNLFEWGLDSLQIIQITRRLRRTVRVDGFSDWKSISPHIIYSHPTLHELSSFLFEAVSPKQKLGTNPSDAARSQWAQGQQNGSALPQEHEIATREYNSQSLVAAQMRSIFSKYVASLPRSVHKLHQTAFQKRVVLLTGSTGSLGSYILDNLGRCPDVAHIFCLNRSKNATHTQMDRSRERGLEIPGPKRVEFLQADLSKALLGLEETVYRRVARTVTHIIRKSIDTCQWQ